MVSKKVVDLINDQIKAELESEYIYLAMAVWAGKNGFKGARNFLFKQATEEHAHAMKFINFLAEIDEKAVIPEIEKPKNNYKSLMEVFESGLKHEKKITARIHKLVALSEEEKDYISADFLQWYVSEQVEEEKTFRDIVKMITMAGESPQVLFMIDSKLGAQ